MPSVPSTTDTLVDLARAARTGSTEQVLVEVADAVRRTTGFGTCVVNVYRPAWHEYEAVVVAGSEVIKEALLGSRINFDSLHSAIQGIPERAPGVVFVPAELGRWDGVDFEVYDPPGSGVHHPNAWQSQDAELVLLRDLSGHPLGVVSVDEPASGMRPTDAELRLLSAIAQYAEQALETAILNELRVESERVSAALLRCASELVRCSTRRQVIEIASQTVTESLGFERAVLYVTRGGDKRLRAGARIGWDDRPEWIEAELPQSRVKTLLNPVLESSGSWLIPAHELFPDQPSGSRSRRNGRGLGGWNDNCLLFPVVDERDGRVTALLVLEDPVDHALPNDQRRRAVRIMMDQASVVVSRMDARDELVHMATHDPLTGLRNRRGMYDEIKSHQSVGVLICDLDHFKSINDRHGHATGDQVLRMVGDLLRECAREGDVPIRTGGEEFCMVLPHTAHQGAIDAAERLRAIIEERLRDAVPGGVTVSIGVAAAATDLLSVDDLLAAADRGLYAAKQGGRNRVAVWQPQAESEPTI